LCSAEDRDLHKISGFLLELPANLFLLDSLQQNAEEVFVVTLKGRARDISFPPRSPTALNRYSELMNQAAHLWANNSGQRQPNIDHAIANARLQLTRRA
jgi:hypothetical protein